MSVQSADPGRPYTLNKPRMKQPMNEWMNIPAAQTPQHRVSRCAACLRLGKIPSSQSYSSSQPPQLWGTIQGAQVCLCLGIYFLTTVQCGSAAVCHLVCDISESQGVQHACTWGSILPHNRTAAVSLHIFVGISRCTGLPVPGESLPHNRTLRLCCSPSACL